MRLASFELDGRRTWGVHLGDHVWSADALGVADRWPSLLDLIRADEDAIPTVREAVARGAAAVSATEIRLLAPIPAPPQNPVAVGLNYPAHTDESAPATGLTDGLAFPMLFTKARTSIIGPDEAIRIDPRATEQADWEVELTVVIGRGGRDIPEEAALDHVFGYTVGNDVSARDLQFRDPKLPQFYQGKSLDTFCPIGPWIVTSGDLDVADLRISLRVNGQSKQEGSTAQMIFGVPELIAEISRSRTIERGELILTGTPAGVGFMREPPEFLRDGDVVEAEIEGIGVLRNPVVLHPPQSIDPVRAPAAPIRREAP
jgi:2-keto-4-pentenoate hydratase/2-oxohepta-3-ene-1,7-dioic acid hydratase in catechol pathway